VTRTRLLLALAIGSYLAATPFLRYSGVGHAGIAHRNHAPRHGGQLAMVGDHHIELRRAGGSVEAFVSDAARRPLRPRGGRVVFDDGAAAADLVWDGYRLRAADVASARSITAAIELGNETLEATFTFEPSRKD